VGLEAEDSGEAVDSEAEDSGEVEDSEAEDSGEAEDWDSEAAALGLCKHSRCRLGCRI
jgi:hypothetical protein